MELSWYPGVPHSMDGVKRESLMEKMDDDLGVPLFYITIVSVWLKYIIYFGYWFHHTPILIIYFPISGNPYINPSISVWLISWKISGTTCRWPSPASPEPANIWNAMAWNNRNGALALSEVYTGENHMKNLCKYKFAGDFWDNAIIINHWGMIWQQLSQSSQEKHLYDLQGQGSFWETLKKTSVQSPGLTLDTPGEKLVDVGNIAYCWLVASQWRRWTTHQFVTNSSSKQKGHEARFRDPPSHG